MRRLLLFLTLIALPASAQPEPDLLETMRYRYVGPSRGGRVTAVAGHPAHPGTFYMGATGGGVFKTTDYGHNWHPISDGFFASPSIGAIAVAESNPDIVYVSTGSDGLRSNVIMGKGVYRSDDAGETWRRIGLENTGNSGAVLIHPDDPDTAWVAAIGNPFIANPERGVYRTRDGGDTGTRLEGNGLPRLDVGKVAVCMTKEDSRRVYALIATADGIPYDGAEAESGELWMSRDGGETWTIQSHNRNLAGRNAYYARCGVSPDDPDEAYFLTASFASTLDAGVSHRVHSFDEAPGWDHHDIWIDPTDADRTAVAPDCGVSISENRGRSWFKIQLPLAQMYHVPVDNDIPYNVLGNRQDGPSTRGPSRAFMGGFFDTGIPRGMWHGVGGGERGFATPDPEDPNIVWSSASGAGAAGGIVVRYDERARQFRQLEVWPESTLGWPAEDLRYRFQWVFPLLISPHDRNTIYVGSQYVMRTTNGGQSWEEISPDLTTNDKSRQTISGGLTPDNIGVEYCCVVYAIDESPVTEGVIWAGTNDGKMHLTRDGGANWTEVTGNIPDMPVDGVVRNIDASKWDAGKAYMTVEAHQVGNFAPYVYRTEDYGQSWTMIVNGVKDSPLSYTRNVREDPVRQGLLYLGTENFLYVSFDDGDNWQRLANGLPPSPMYWIQVQEHFGDLVVGTYGRGFWILDDISPLQQWTDEVEAASVHLFEPRGVYRFQPMTSPFAQFADWSARENPPYGAPIHFWLDEAAEDVSLEIRNASGTPIRTLEAEGEAGLNRVWWNLREDASTQAVMRTRPRFADWVDLGNDRTRESQVGRISILAPPGDYTVALMVGDEEQTAPIEVRKDPNSEGSLEDIAAQTELLRLLRADLEMVAGMVNEIEWFRRQVLDLKALAEDAGRVEDIASLVDGFDGSLLAIEENLIQLLITGTGQDQIRWPTQLAGKITYLAGAVASADFPPTDQMREVYEKLHAQVMERSAEFDEVVESDLSGVNGMLESTGMPTIVRVEKDESGS